MAKDMGTNDGLGSNNWVVAGSKTRSGKPLLANDPHLGLSAPAIWYFARLQSPEGRAGDGELDAVIVAVRGGALADVVTQVVAGGKAVFNTKFKHCRRNSLPPGCRR